MQRLQPVNDVNSVEETMPQNIIKYIELASTLGLILWILPMLSIVMHSTPAAMPVLSVFKAKVKFTDGH